MTYTTMTLHCEELESNVYPRLRGYFLQGHLSLLTIRTCLHYALPFVLPICNYNIGLFI